MSSPSKHPYSTPNNIVSSLFSWKWKAMTFSRTSRRANNERCRCDQCGRTYSRRDHLARHVQSHTSQRPFVCSHCGKDFARGDLLLRHSALHTVENSRSGCSSRRVSRACQPCAGAKVKCHDRKPCRRCLKRGIPCISPSSEYTPVSTSAECSNTARDATLNSPGSPTFEIAPQPFTDDSMTDTSWCMTGPYMLDTSRPSLTPDVGTGLGTMSFGDMLLETLGSGGSREELITTGRIRQANEAFKESLWYSIPNQGLSSPPVNGESDVLTGQLRSSVPQRFNHSTRDNLLVSLTLFARGQSMECLRSLQAGFPSPILLDTLTHLFLAKQDRKIDSWIHSASFQPNPSNLELTIMIVATSALNTSFATLRQLGTDLRRLLRPIILNKLENEYETSRRLQLYQASLLSLELDLWHDEDDCLGRAGRFSSIIATLLRQELGDGKPELKTLPLATDDIAETTKNGLHG
ncbi:hypothetical protein GQ43DRAFT_109222 [Delitschia confertaspora ATCC 74209]|uniref:Zinc finger, C2H2 type n=1 Tax=Delitschia confertaspora ATCC 74209 TaxID=1513339 RepID=A0A9P4JYI3_9PLEO|nr:hypothetical protein GQ43DRAFT_109222 [Delitschia confertaspora ATCC 74209]